MAARGPIALDFLRAAGVAYRSDTDGSPLGTRCILAIEHVCTVLPGVRSALLFHRFEYWKKGTRSTPKARSWRGARQEAWFAQLPPDAIAIVEAAIMIETGSYRRYDRMILTVCRPELQIARAMQRDDLTEAQVRERLARQMPESEKRKYALYVIDTSGTPNETLEQTAEVCAQLKR